MRTIFLILTVLMSCVFASSAKTQSETVPSGFCTAQASFLRGTEMLVLELFCPLNIMAKEEAESQARAVLSIWGLHANRTLYRAIPVKPEDGRSPGWTLIYLAPQVRAYA